MDAIEHGGLGVEAEDPLELGRDDQCAPLGRERLGALEDPNGHSLAGELIRREEPSSGRADDNDRLFLRDVQAWTSTSAPPPRQNALRHRAAQATAHNDRCSVSFFVTPATSREPAPTRACSRRGTAEPPLAGNPTPAGRACVKQLSQVFT
jgi:hypothetical protein